MMRNILWIWTGLAAALIVALCRPSQASQPFAAVDAYKFDTILASSSTAVAFSTNDYVARGAIFEGGTTRMQCVTETANMRYRVDGTSPTTTTGMFISTGTSFTLDGYNSTHALIMIGVTSTSTVDCTFYK